MTNSDTASSPGMNARETVLSLVRALNEEDFQTARTFVRDDFIFGGVLGSRKGAEAYFRDMTNMRLKYDVKKISAEENDVCLLYELNISQATVFCCGWYQTIGGKISSLRVIFDPRPILKAPPKK